MSDERIRIDLERTGDRWAADLERLGDEAAQRVIGSGPGEVLEQVGQYLDAREARRLTTAHGLQELLDYVAPRGPREFTPPAPELTAAAERVLEVLEDSRGRWRNVAAIARDAWPELDTLEAIRRAELELERLLATVGDVDSDRAGGWRLMGESER